MTTTEQVHTTPKRLMVLSWVSFAKSSPTFPAVRSRKRYRKHIKTLCSLITLRRRSSNLSFRRIANSSKYSAGRSLQIPPRPDHLHGQNLPPRRTESAMLMEHYTTVVSNSPPELFHRHSGLQALCLSHKLVCAKVTAGDVDFLSAKSSEQFRYREFQNHST